MFKLLTFLFLLIASCATAEHSQTLKFQLDPVWDDEEAAQASNAQCTTELMDELGLLFHDWIDEARYLLYMGGASDADIGEAILTEHEAAHDGGRGLEISAPVERDLYTLECVENCEMHALILRPCFTFCLMCFTCTCAPGLICDANDDNRKARALRGLESEGDEPPIIEAIDEFESFVGLYLEMKVQEWDNQQVTEDRACLGNQGEAKAYVRMFVN
jgi:hypothetical protein